MRKDNLRFRVFEGGARGAEREWGHRSKIEADAGEEGLKQQKLLTIRIVNLHFRTLNLGTVPNNRCR